MAVGVDSPGEANNGAPGLKCSLFCGQSKKPRLRFADCCACRARQDTGPRPQQLHTCTLMATCCSVYAALFGSIYLLHVGCWCSRSGMSEDLFLVRGTYTLLKILIDCLRYARGKTGLCSFSMFERFTRGLLCSASDVEINFLTVGGTCVCTIGCTVCVVRKLRVFFFSRDMHCYMYL